jgi:hypothetical protein
MLRVQAIGLSGSGRRWRPASKHTLTGLYVMTLVVGCGAEYYAYCLQFMNLACGCRSLLCIP